MSARDAREVVWQAVHDATAGTDLAPSPIVDAILAALSPDGGSVVVADGKVTAVEQACVHYDAAGLNSPTFATYEHERGPRCLPVYAPKKPGT